MMTQKRASLIWHWATMLLWMGIVFYLSHQPKADLSPMQPSTLIVKTNAQWLMLPTLDWDTIVGKLAHVAVFGILAFHVSRLNPRVAVILGITIGYALSDEFHQLFIPGRTGRLFDVLFDGLGALLMVSWLHYVSSKRQDDTADLQRTDRIKIDQPTVRDG